MQIYTNRFTFAIDEKCTEVVLNFFQAIPNLKAFNDKASIENDIPLEIEPVAQLVMSYECAQELSGILSEALRNNKKDTTP